MQRRNRNNNNRRQQPRRNPRRAPRTISKNVASGRDMIVQSRTFMNYNQLAYSNVEGDFAFGISSFNVTPKNNTMIADILDSYARLYEQYRVRRVVVRAQCGKGYTNDRRTKTLLVSRVDVDNHDTANTFASFRALANATNAKTRTLTEKGNIKLVDYRPVMFDNYYSSGDTNPILPNSLQWYRLVARANHQWRGAVFGCAIPENTLSPSELKITLVQEITVEFRGRIQDAATLVSSPTISTLNPPVYDLTISEELLKTELLTGAYFPINFPHSIGNIGSSVTGDMLIGNTFRIQADMTLYAIVAAVGGNLHCNKVE